MWVLRSRVDREESGRGVSGRREGIVTRALLDSFCTTLSSDIHTNNNRPHSPLHSPLTIPHPHPLPTPPSSPQAREAVQSVIAESTDASTGAVPLPDVAAAFAAAGCDLTPHELVTLGRRLGDERGKAPIPAAKLLQEVGLSGN